MSESTADPLRALGDALAAMAVQTAALRLPARFDRLRMICAGLPREHGADTQAFEAFARQREEGYG